MGLFDNPNAGPFLMTAGLGLMQAGQPQPYGVNRFSHIANALQMAQQNMMQQQQAQREKQKFDLQMGSAKSQGSAQSKLFGGYDPRTGINFETGRAPGLMDQHEISSLMAQAYPENFAKDLFARDKGDYTFGNWVAEGTRNPITARRSKSGNVEVFNGREWIPMPGRGAFVGLEVQGGLSDLFPGLGPQTAGEQPPALGPQGPADVAYGLPGVLGQAANTVVGYMTGEVPFPNIQDANTSLNQLHSTTTLMLNNLTDRDTNQTRQIIMGMMPSVPWTTDPAAKKKYDGIVTILKSEIAKKEKVASGTGAYLPKAVSDARQDLDTYRTLLEAYQKIVDNWATPSQGPRSYHGVPVTPVP